VQTNNLMLQLTFTRGLSEDLSSEVKVMKKVKGRGAEEKEQAERQLLKQVGGSLCVEREAVSSMELL